LGDLDFRPLGFVLVESEVRLAQHFVKLINHTPEGYLSKPTEVNTSEIYCLLTHAISAISNYKKLSQKPPPASPLSAPVTVDAAASPVSPSAGSSSHAAAARALQPVSPLLMGARDATPEDLKLATNLSSKADASKAAHATIPDCTDETNAKKTVSKHPLGYGFYQDDERELAAMSDRFKFRSGWYAPPALPPSATHAAAAGPQLSPLALDGKLQGASGLFAPLKPFSADDKTGSSSSESSLSPTASAIPALDTSKDRPKADEKRRSGSALTEALERQTSKTIAAGSLPVATTIDHPKIKKPRAFSLSDAGKSPVTNSEWFAQHAGSHARLIRSPLRFQRVPAAGVPRQPAATSPLHLTADSPTAAVNNGVAPGTIPKQSLS
jgi:hypothetical protein